MARKKSEFLSAFGVSLNIFKAITDAVLAEGGSDEDIRSLLSDPDKCRRVALEIVGRKAAVASSDALERITVPSLSATELCELAQTKLNLTYLNPDLAKWGFVTDDGGKIYEVMVWAPGRCVRTDEVRKHFPTGFAGNTAAFVAWATANNPMGWHVSIPEDGRLFPHGGSLYAPRFYRGDDHRRLGLDVVHGGWGVSCSFVAFREVTST